MQEMQEGGWTRRSLQSDVCRMGRWLGRIIPCLNHTSTSAIGSVFGNGAQRREYGREGAHKQRETKGQAFPSAPRWSSGGVDES